MVNVPFSVSKGHVYHVETCPLPVFVKIVYRRKAYYGLSFSISSEKPDISYLSL